MNTISNAYIKDNDKCFTPVYAPGELYSFYINFDVPTNDPDFGNFALNLYKGDELIFEDVGTLENHVVKGVDLYNIFCNFEFPDVPNGQYQFVIEDAVNGIEKCRSNVILCERDEFELITQNFVYYDEENIFNFYYELLPDYKNRFRLPLAMVDYQYETERTQYRNVSDNRLRNLTSFRDKVAKIESYGFDQAAHDAITAAYEHEYIFINGAGITPKSAYQVVTNQNSTITKGTIDVYLNGNVLDDFGDAGLFGTIIDAGDADAYRDIIIDSNF